METVTDSVILTEPTSEPFTEPKAARPKLKTKAKGKAATPYGPLAPSSTDKPLLRWTEDDEADLRELLARRKAAGYRKPSRDVGGQVIKLGRITPNPNTVAASIVALVGLKGEVTRRDLIADMADCTFPHPKAQPKDPQWCTGYISGCVRSAFLEIVPPVEG